MFFSEFIKKFNECFPLKKCAVNAKKTYLKNKPWYNEELARLKGELAVAYEIFIMSGDSFDRAYYLELKNNYKSSIKNAKLSYNALIIENSDNKCRAAWSIIKQVSGQNRSNSVPISPNCLNDFFINSINSIRSSIDLPIATYEQFLSNSFTPGELFQFKPISESDVNRVIFKLKNSKSVDYYGISNWVVKGVSDLIAAPLSTVVNLCLNEGIFPHALKISKVTPIHKSGERKDPANYRPVSLVPILSKIFENLVFEQVSAFL